MRISWLRRLQVGVVLLGLSILFVLNACTQPTLCVQPPSDLSAWWPLDEASGTTAKDLAGTKNNQGTHKNGPTPKTGKVAGALSFDGSDDYVEVSDDPELDVGTGSFTIDAWVKTTKKANAALLEKMGTSAGYGLGLQYLQDQNKVVPVLALRATPQGQQQATTEPHSAANAQNVADGNWHHIAAVVDPGAPAGAKKVIIYVDGNEVYNATTSSIVGQNLDNTDNLYLGSKDGTSDFFTGDLDEVELFKRALTKDEIEKIFKAGSAGKCKP